MIDITHTVPVTHNIKFFNSLEVILSANYIIIISLVPLIKYTIIETHQHIQLYMIFTNQLEKKKELNANSYK